LKGTIAGLEMKINSKSATTDFTDICSREYRPLTIQFAEDCIEGVKVHITSTSIAVRVANLVTRAQPINVLIINRFNSICGANIHEKATFLFFRDNVSTYLHNDRRGREVVQEGQKATSSRRQRAADKKINQFCFPRLSLTVV
jgi:hypothetical protein